VISVKFAAQLLFLGLSDVNPAFLCPTVIFATPSSTHYRLATANGNKPYISITLLTISAVLLLIILIGWKKTLVHAPFRLSSTQSKRVRAFVPK
jgi:hypothetical protein